MSTKLIPINPRVEDEALVEAETRLGQAFPAPLRTLFKRADGVYVEPDYFLVEWPTTEGDVPELAQLHYLFDLATLVKESTALRERLPARALAIGQDPGGSLLLMLTDGDHAGQIRFWPLAYDQFGEGDNVSGTGIVADSLEAFFDTLEPEPDF